MVEEVVVVVLVVVTAAEEKRRPITRLDNRAMVQAVLFCCRFNLPLPYRSEVINAYFRQHSYCKIGLLYFRFHFEFFDSLFKSLLGHINNSFVTVAFVYLSTPMIEGRRIEGELFKNNLFLVLSIAVERKN